MVSLIFVICILADLVVRGLWVRRPRYHLPSVRQPLCATSMNSVGAQCPSSDSKSGILPQNKDLRPILCLKFVRQAICGRLECVGVYFEILTVANFELVFAWNLISSHVYSKIVEEHINIAFWSVSQARFEVTLETKDHAQCQRISEMPRNWGHYSPSWLLIHCINGKTTCRQTPEIR